ncbi:T9SS type A sorting domain-containing protein [Mesoflavibacter sp. SCSIO 43206]|uniref:T9SS type A sorting domain-containing protein n=1 Tax=Mesoflavibacter sp. SCSIO 43206 TaxID=2779362 RepID=UPI001CA8E6AC|nr:T9SS type A sorting domain-containing protein [Mesoflavibacter sp. SCSIO 43206]UAB74753.1 T9SS type A sorting domain-containing protein [Mesoflavibacter sp. SCSIO 43206]
MKHIYFFSLLFSISCITKAQETLTFSSYNGNTTTLTATTATVNDEITIVFEDQNIINNFYSDGQAFIHMYGGLDTDSGSFQGAPGFSDLASQPQLTLVPTDTDVNAGPNTYSITINLAQLYTVVPNETMVYGFNLLFQNQFGGGGNNQTVDFYINLVDAEKDSTLSTADNNIKNANVKVISNELLINNYNGDLNIKVYDILGKIVDNNANIQVKNSYKHTLDLPKNNIYIVVLETKDMTKTIKVLL